MLSESSTITHLACCLHSLAIQMSTITDSDTGHESIFEKPRSEIPTVPLPPIGGDNPIAKVESIWEYEPLLGYQVVNENPLSSSGEYPEEEVERVRRQHESRTLRKCRGRPPLWAVGGESNGSVHNFSRAIPFQHVLRGVVMTTMVQKLPGFRNVCRIQLLAQCKVSVDRQNARSVVFQTKWRIAMTYHRWSKENWRQKMQG